MNTVNYNIKRAFRFRRWSRAGYAVFCSLSADVTIGRVCKSICEMSFRKSNGVTKKQASCALYVDEETEDEAELKALLAECQSPVEQMSFLFTVNPATAVVVAFYNQYYLTQAVGMEFSSVSTAFFINHCTRKYSGRLHRETQSWHRGAQSFLFLLRRNEVTEKKKTQ